MTPYASRELFKTYARIDADDTTDDDLFDVALAAARTAIDRSARRRFDASGAVEPRVFTARIDPKTLRTVIDVDDTFSDADEIDLAYDPLQEGAFTTAVSGDFRAWPYDAGLKDRPFIRLIMHRATAVPIGEVEVTTSYGWEATPDTIVQANLLQAARYLKRRDSPLGVAGSPDMESELRLLSKLDPDVELMVADYRRWT